MVDPIRHEGTRTQIAQEPKGQLITQDILSQPQVLQAVRDAFRHQAGSLDPIKSGARQWVFTGCGTTYALGLSASACFRRQGIPAMALPASEISFYPEWLPAAPSVLAAVSRSGETSETLWAVEAFRAQRPGDPVLALTAAPQARLAGLVDVVLGAEAAKDIAVVETVSFCGMLYLAQLAGAWLSGDQLRLAAVQRVPECIDRVMTPAQALAQTVMQSQPERFFFLGGGPYFGVACQSSFTIKECSGGWVEAFHPLEFRHGPRMAATAGSLVVLFVSAEHGDQELAVLKDLKAQGVTTVAIVDDRQGTSLAGADHVLELHSGLEDWERLVLLMPFVQWLATYHAMSAGLDPDHPSHLQAVTVL